VNKEKVDHGGTEHTEERNIGGILSVLHEEQLSSQIIGAAIEVHRELGPGLLESAYEECLCHELQSAGLAFKRQISLPVSYKSIRLNCGYRADLIVEDKVVVELKSVDQLTDLHKAQLLTYLRISNVRVGLMFNFNVEVLKHGLVRLVL
jgi:GxxExxY protein